MERRINRRDFIGRTALAVAAGAVTANNTRADSSSSASKESKSRLPRGKIGNLELSRLLLGGNLISGYAHARDLAYVSQLMKRYNTEAKILETLELAEQHGINGINLAIWDNISFLHKHWKNGGKMKLIAQALPSPEGDLSQFKKAVDMGASAVHIQGHGAERLVKEGELDLLAKIIDLIRSQKVPAGVASHSLSVVYAVEKAKIDVDFYVKTLHTRDYHTAPPPNDKSDLGRFDNSWCADADEVIETMEGIPKPWIAFKVMAAGAIHPRRAFPFAFNGGADFILAGMFDWQIEEDVQIAIEAINECKRVRPWRA